jgi:hypothetical protein
MAYGTSSRGQSYGVCSTVPLELEPLVVVVFNLGYIPADRSRLFDYYYLYAHTGMLWQQPTVLQPRNRSSTGTNNSRSAVFSRYEYRSTVRRRLVVVNLAAAILNTCRALLYRSK